MFILSPSARTGLADLALRAKVVQTVVCSTFTRRAKPATRRVADGERMNPQGGGAFAPIQKDDEHQGGGTLLAPNPALCSSGEQYQDAGQGLRNLRQIDSINIQLNNSTREMAWHRQSSLGSRTETHICPSHLLWPPAVFGWQRHADRNALQ